MKKFWVHTKCLCERSAFVEVMADNEAAAEKIALEAAYDDDSLYVVTFEDGEAFDEHEVVDIREIPYDPYKDWDMRSEGIS
jgi:hypothetical protein